MIARVVECQCHDLTYGMLKVENVSAAEVQQRIYEIKNKFYDENIDDWTIEDVFKQFPDEWEWSWVDQFDEVEI